MQSALARPQSLPGDRSLRNPRRCGYASAARFAIVAGFLLDRPHRMSARATPDFHALSRHFGHWQKVGDLIDQCIEHFLHAKIVNCRAKKYGSLFARQKSCRVKGRCRRLNELDFAYRLFKRATKAFGNFRIVEPVDKVVTSIVTPFLSGFKQTHAIALNIKHATKGFAHADWP